MKFSNIIFFAVAVFCNITIEAQVQQGYVKSLGRPNQKGQALSGVSVRVKGAHNAVLSRNDGTFGMTIQGDSYVLQQVQKSGYDLKEHSVIGREYAYSSQVPLTIVMVSSKQLQEDRQKIENKAYEVAERNYKSQMDLLEKQKNSNSITIEQYRQQIQELQARFEKFQSMIESLANHYAHTDYDNLDEKEREINIYIENGELEKAEALLNSIGIQQKISEIEKNLKDAQQMKDAASEDWAAVMKKQEKDAEYLYQLYTISLARFDNKKAQFYIETRAELDTTNVEWQINAAEFASSEGTSIDRSFKYYARALRQSIRINGPNNPLTLKCYLMMAIEYGSRNNYNKSEEYINIVWNTIQKDNKNYIKEEAEYYYTNGYLLYERGMYQLSGKEIEKAINIICKNGIEDMQALSKYYGHYGGYFNKIGDYDKAINYFEKALDIIKENNSSPVNQVYLKTAIASSYIVIDKREEALLFLNDALTQLKKMYGDKDAIPVAKVYQELANLYTRKLEPEKAIKYAYTALNMHINILGPNNIVVANNYLYLGNIYVQCSKYEDGLKCYREALRIKKNVCEESDVEIASCYLNFGYLYLMQKKINIAKHYCEEAINILNKSRQKDYLLLASAYNNLGMLYAGIEDYTSANKYLMLSLELKNKKYTVPNSDIAITYSNFADVYAKQKDINNAIKYINKALSIMIPIASENNLMVANMYFNLGNYYAIRGDFDESIIYYHKAHITFKNLYGKDDKRTKIAKESIDGLRNNILTYEPSRAATLLERANLYQINNRINESEQMYVEALRNYRILSIQDPQAFEPLLAATMNNLAVLYSKIQRFNESEQMYMEVLEIRKRLAKANPKEYKSSLSDILGNISALEIFLKKFAVSEQYAREGISLDPTQTWIYTNLAAALLFQGKYSEAEQIYRQYKDELKDGFLDDFNQFKKAEVIPKEREEDVKKIKRILNE